MCVSVVCCLVHHSLLLLVPAAVFPLVLGWNLLPASKLIIPNSIYFHCQVSMTLGTGQMLLFASVLQVSKIKQDLEKNKMQILV
jgi:hypothetical protein